MCNLSIFLSDSDPDATVEWFGRATDSGSLTVLKNLARMHSSDSGVPMDKAAAADLYRRAADLGDPGAQYDLAFMLDSGEGVPRDRAEAERLFRLSVDQGDSNACLCIDGILYEKGDYPGAEGYFTFAVMKGDVKAAYNLRLVYSKELLRNPTPGKPRNGLRRCLEGLRLRANQPRSILYNRGDIASTERWFRLAVDQNESTAMYNLSAFGASEMIEMGKREVMEVFVKTAFTGVEEARVLISELTSGSLLRENLL